MYRISRRTHKPMLDVIRPCWECRRPVVGSAGIFRAVGRTQAHLCSPCMLIRRERRAPYMFSANKAVNQAVRRGELPRVKDCLCVDCGAPAHDYDHRDYSKPLDVVPVCRSCNVKRGPAAISAVQFPPLYRPALDFTDGAA